MNKIIEEETPYQYKKLSQQSIEIALKEDGISLRPKQVKQITYMSKAGLKSLYKTVGRTVFMEYFRLLRVYTDFEGYEYFKEIEKQRD